MNDRLTAILAAIAQYVRKNLVAPVLEMARLHQRDLKTMGILFVLGMMAAMAYMYAWRGPYTFYQERLGPAVMLTCGKGFTDPNLKECPALQEFLASKRPSLSRADIPTALHVSPPTIFQSEHRYLYTAIAVTWKLFGISWRALIPLFGLLYGLTIAALYLLFRLGMRRPLAVVATALLIISPVHLGMLPALRDYAKAPFMIMAFCLLGAIVKYPLRPLILWQMSALFGALLGIGIGFRMDLLICLPAFITTVFLFLPAKSNTLVKTRLIALASFACTYYLVGYPILSAQSGGSNMFHFFLLGLTEPFSQMMRVTTPFYSTGPFYMDEYVASMVNGYAYHHFGNQTLLTFFTREYDHYCYKLFLDFCRHFPADMITRAYAAIFRILDELPFNRLEAFHNENLTYPSVVTSRGIIALYGIRLFVLHCCVGSGKIAAVLALILLSLRRRRVAIFGIFFLLYFVGHTSLQFALRHVFHLEFIAFWMIGFLVNQSWDGILYWRQHERLETTWLLRVPKRHWGARLLKRGILFISMSILFLVGGLYIARGYQHYHVHRLIREYTAMPLAKLEVTTREAGNNLVLISPTQQARETSFFPNQQAFVTHTDYLVFKFNLPEKGSIPVIFSYVSAKQENNLSYQTTLTGSSVAKRTGNALTTYYMPLYETTDAFWLSWRKFNGIAMNKNDLSYLEGVYRVNNPGNLPLLLQLNLPPNWEELPQTQRLY